MLRAVATLFAFTCAGAFLGAILVYPFAQAEHGAKGGDAPFVVGFLTMLGGIAGGVLGSIVGLARVIVAYVSSRAAGRSVRASTKHGR